MMTLAARMEQGRRGEGNGGEGWSLMGALCSLSGFLLLSGELYLAKNGETEAL